MDEPLDRIMRDYLLSMREGLLKQVDAIERLLGISPRTAELRQAEKARIYNEHVGKEIPATGND